jgi:hypothetical protein
MLPIRITTSRMILDQRPVFQVPNDTFVRRELFAEKCESATLLKHIALLSYSIKRKNRDTPNYAAGERRSAPDS